jgi:hypothetical protein
MSQSENRKAPPQWLGFHRDGLIAVFLLDCLWMLIETGAAISIVGIPAIPVIVFVIFGLSSYIVFSKQRILGDRPASALVKAVFLGAVAAVPFPVFYTMLLAVISILHRLLPQASNAAAKVGSTTTATLFKDERFGRFANDFKEIEDILAEAVRKVDRSQVSSEVFENIKFLNRKGMISEDLCNSLHEIRQIRNKLVHEDLIMPDSVQFDLLGKCKQQVMAVFKP